MALQTPDRKAAHPPLGGSYPVAPERPSPASAPWPLLPPLALFALAALAIGWPWLSGDRKSVV